MIENIRKGFIGAIEFDGKFDGMRKPQEFIVYPIGAGEDASRIKIQSDSRIGWIDLNDGKVSLSPSIRGGAYFPHLSLARYAGKLLPEDLLVLKGNLVGNASAEAGCSVLKFDNSGAVNVPFGS